MPLDRNDPEVRALIEEVTAEATAPLIAKRDELLREVKTLKSTRVDNAEVTKLQDKVDELASQLQSVTGERDSAQREVVKTQKAVEKRDAALQRHLVDAGLTDALAKAGVAPHFLEAARAMLRSTATVKATGDDYVAQIGDKPLAEAVKEWASADVGKHFVSAPANAGGGAGGAPAPAGSGTRNPYARDSVNLTEQALLERDNPTQAATLRTAAGV